jgi:hypothetical protein
VNRHQEVPPDELVEFDVVNVAAASHLRRVQDDEDVVRVNASLDAGHDGSPGELAGELAR